VTNIVISIRLVFPDPVRRACLRVKNFLAWLGLNAGTFTEKPAVGGALTWKFHSNQSGGSLTGMPVRDRNLSSKGVWRGSARRRSFGGHGCIIWTSGAADQTTGSPEHWYDVGSSPWIFFAEVSSCLSNSTDFGPAGASLLVSINLCVSDVAYDNKADNP
jgi:hypothetical protein